ncbi:MAG: hypothetical protein ABI683_08525 [Ginsengibacter sp.]
MTKTKHTPSTLSAVIAIVFLIPSLVLYLLWKGLGNDLNPAEKMAAYLAKFPTFMQHLAVINILSIACCVLAITFAARSFRKRLLSIRLLMMLTVIAAVLIILFDVYQLVQVQA